MANTLTLSIDGSDSELTLSTGARGPRGSQGESGDDGIVAQVIQTSITAELDRYYHAVSTLTVSDPTTPTEGKGFVVFVRNGTITVGGIEYSTSGTLIHRIWHSGSYSNYVYLDKAQLDSNYANLSGNNTWTNSNSFSGGIVLGANTLYGLASTFTYLGTAATTHRAALGIPTYANLTAANVALSAGQVYYDTALGTLNTATS